MVSLLNGSAFGSGFSSRSRSNSNGSTVSSSSRPTEDPDQWYYDLIEQYKDNPEAYEYLLSNPYLRSKISSFSPNLGQSLLMGLGDYSAQDNYYNEFRQKALNFYSEWAKSMYEQKFESPVEQVRRESAAGINSDLAPQSVSPGEAAENDQPFDVTQMPGAGEGVRVAGEMAQYGLQFISGIMAFGKQIQDFNIGSFQKIGLELGASSSASDYVLGQLAGLSDSDLQSPENVLKNLDLSSYSRSTRKFLQRYITRFNDSENLGLATKVAEYRNEMLRANRDSANIMSSPYYSKDLSKWTNDIMENFSKYVAASEKFVAANSAIRANVENVFLDNEGNQNILGENMAEGVNAELQTNKSTAEAAKYKAEMERSWNQLEKSVKGDGSHWYNTIGMILLNFLRAQVSQPLHLGVSSSSHESNSSSAFGSSHSEGSRYSWHF